VSSDMKDEGRMIEELLEWFSATKRDLPWRKSYDPYHVWISEIMLQQTQMERGVSYFLRWVERFPKVDDVAEAAEEEILKYWEGLGYYARARNLQKAAKILVRDFGGEVPCEYDTLLRLPGIGPYTAAAIASVAGNRDVAVVDANVCRVFARLYDIGEPVKGSSAQKQIRSLAESLLPPGKARRYNQALMDLGGLVCTPKSPRCPQCPIGSYCLARKKGTVHLRPVLAKPKETVTVTRVAGLIRRDEMIYIQKRAGHEVWGGLWEFPGGEVAGTGTEESDPRLVARRIAEDCGLEVQVEQLLCTVQHQYTHHRITLHCYLCELRGGGGKAKPRLLDAVDHRWLPFAELAGYGFPAGPRKVLEYLREHPELL
jgi:A/G-specific adenine glycosylase